MAKSKKVRKEKTLTREQLKAWRSRSLQAAAKAGNSKATERIERSYKAKRDELSKDVKSDSSDPVQVEEEQGLK